MSRFDSRQNLFTRRGFLGGSAATALVSVCRPTMADPAAPDSATDLNMLGPLSGYSTEVGSLVTVWLVL